jgi:hypothetical protein
VQTKMKLQEARHKCVESGACDRIGDMFGQATKQVAKGIAEKLGEFADAVRAKLHVTRSSTEIWIQEDGLPANEGKPADMDKSGVNTLEDMKRACENVPDCVGFAYRPAKKSWYPKMAGTGFVPEGAKYDQRRKRETWEWYYLRKRAQVKSSATDMSPPMKGSQGPTGGKKIEGVAKEAAEAKKHVAKLFAWRR